MPQTIARFSLLSALCLALAACVTTGTTTTANQPSTETTSSVNASVNEPVRVTMLLPLSGKDAKLGEAMQNAATLAMADLGYNAFELGFEDTGSNGAATAAARAIKNKSNLLLGPIFADDVRAARGVANPSRVPVIAFSTDSGAGGAGTYLIGILPGDQARQVGTFAAVKGLKNVLVVAPRDVYGQLTVRAFAASAQSNGVSVIGPFWLDNNDALLAARLKALIAPGSDGKAVDGIFMPLPADQATRILGIINPMFQSTASKPILLGTGLWDDVNIMKYPGLVGGYYAAPARETRTRFEQIYTRQFGAKPPRLASLAYDSVALALTLGRVQGAAGLTEAGLTGTNGFSGINGLFRFTRDGQSERQLPILQLQPGRAVIAIPAATSF